MPALIGNRLRYWNRGADSAGAVGLEMFFFFFFLKIISASTPPCLIGRLADFPDRPDLGVRIEEGAGLWHRWRLLYEADHRRPVGRYRSLIFPRRLSSFVLRRRGEESAIGDEHSFFFESIVSRGAGALSFQTG